MVILSFLKVWLFVHHGFFHTHFYLYIVALISFLVLPSISQLRQEPQSLDSSPALSGIHPSDSHKPEALGY